MYEEDYFVLNKQLAKINQNSQKITFNQCEVIFPFTHIPNCQREYMQNVMKTLTKKEDIALQSTTGSGKTLALLTTTCAYIQKKYQQTGERKKIFYLSKSHSQLSQIQKQLEKTCYRPNMLMFGSKQNLCINQKIEEHFKNKQGIHYSDWDNKCEQAVKQKIKLIKDDYKIKNYGKDLSCPYYEDYDINRENEIFNSLKHQCLSNDKMKQFGKKHKFCPALYPKRMKNQGTLYLMPYIYFTKLQMLPYYKDLIQNSIIIFDEGHNFIESACQGSNIQLGSQFLRQVWGTVLNFQNNKNNCVPSKIQDEQKWRWLQSLQKKPVNSNIQQKLQEGGYYDKKIRTLLRVVDYMIKCSQKIMKEKYEQFAFQQKKAYPKKFYSKKSQHYRSQYDIQSNIQFLFFSQMKSEDYQQCSLSNQSLKKTLEGINSLAKQVLLYIKSYKGYAFKLEQFKMYIERMSQIITDSQLAKKYFITWDLEWHYKQTKKNGDIKIKCLSAQYVFKKIKQFNPNSIIITSGTLAPLQLWPQELNDWNMNIYSVKSEIKNDRIRINAITKFKQFGNFQTNNTKFNNNEKYMKYFINNVLKEMVALIPNGVVVVLRSKDQVKKFKNQIQNNSQLLKSLKSLKDVIVFQEDKNFQSIMIDYKRASEQKQKGALLFCYFNGKISEGIDLPDNQCRGVIIYGVPNINPFDSFTAQKKQLINEQQMFFQGEVFTADTWYQIQAAKSINQAVGRLIRHEKDYGVVFLVDSRYNRLYQGNDGKTQITLNNLSHWIKNNLNIRQNQIDQDVKKQLQQFFVIKEVQQFQKQQNQKKIELQKIEKEKENKNENKNEKEKEKQCRLQKQNIQNSNIQKLSQQLQKKLFLSQKESKLLVQNKQVQQIQVKQQEKQEKILKVNANANANVDVKEQQNQKILFNLKSNNQNFNQKERQKQKERQIQNDRQKQIQKIQMEVMSRQNYQQKLIKMNIKVKEKEYECEQIQLIQSSKLEKNQQLFNQKQSQEISRDIYKKIQQAKYKQKERLQKKHQIQSKSQRKSQSKQSKSQIKSQSTKQQIKSCQIIPNYQPQRLNSRQPIIQPKDSVRKVQYAYNKKVNVNDFLNTSYSDKYNESGGKLMTQYQLANYINNEQVIVTRQKVTNIGSDFNKISNNQLLNSSEKSLQLNKQQQKQKQKQQQLVQKKLKSLNIQDQAKKQ